MPRRHKKRSPKKPKTAKVTTSVRRRKLRHTDRRHFVDLSQLSCSEPVEKPEESGLDSNFSGPTTRLKAATADGRVPSVKRKTSWDSPEETERDSKKPKTESSDDVEPGYYCKRRPKVWAKRRTPMIKKLFKSKIADNTDSRSDTGGSSSVEDGRAPRLCKPTESSDIGAGPSQALDNAQEQPQPAESLASENSSPHEDSIWEIDSIEFNRKYRIIKEIKAGGFGMVYSGIRKEDNFLVAIKRAKASCLKSTVRLNGTWTEVPREVAMLIRVGAGPGEEESNITPLLLDWYDLDAELVMVMEKPEPCMDLIDYVNSLQRSLTEEEAKEIFIQLLDAAINMLGFGVFHRDIKPDNVLIETGRPMVRARFIDFGCGITFDPEEIFQRPSGTSVYFCPEFYETYRYRPEPTTVWQLGLTLYAMLHCKRPFASKNTVLSYEPPLKSDLSDDCKDFLRRIMDKNPETRISMDHIKDHPWMN